jgi:eukaryotic-like serine/threonine-protein kinase
MSPTVLSDRYELGRVLGRGGMAEVREARDLVLGRRVAVKVLHATLADDPAFIERFRREATAVAALNHPSLVGIFDAGSDGDTRYLVMEYLEGQTLADVLRERGRLEPARAVEVGIAAAEALEAVHQAGLVHRDVKPANIMVTPRGGVKLMDLGIARAADATSLTATQSVIGTAAYLSPEQARGLPADARSDLYSLGCVIYEAAAGRRPFQGDSAVSVALQHVNDDPPAPSHLVDGLPEGLDAVLARALAKDPDRRYATAAEMAADLRRLERGDPVAGAALGGIAATQAMTGMGTTAMHPGPEATATMASPVAADTDPEPQGSDRTARWLLAALLLIVGAIVLAAAMGAFDTGDGDDADIVAPGEDVTEPAEDEAPPETEPEPEPEDTVAEETTTTVEETTTTTEPPSDFGAVDSAVAAVAAESDQALADGEIDESARDDLVDMAAKAAEKARDGDEKALDEVEDLREELDDLLDDGDLSRPTFNRIRQAIDDLDSAIRAVL